jgi:hypothetical protein
MTVERWKAFPFYRRILMIANEISRLRDFVRENAEAPVVRETLERAMELADLTIETCDGNVRYELLRWREMLSLVYVGMDYLSQEVEFLEQLYQTLMFFRENRERLIDLRSSSASEFPLYPVPKLLRRRRGRIVRRSGWRGRARTPVRF